MRNYKRYAVLTAVCFVAFLCVSIILVSCGKKDDGDNGDNGNNNNGSQQTAEKSFGVFLGVNEINVSQMSAYDLIVIDADYIEKSQIAALQAKGTKVYSYLNVGMIEEFRDYYKEDISVNHGDLLLAYNEDWEDERWVDVSNTVWQEYVVDTLAAALAGQGVDGFFLDNFDVYYYNNENQEFLDGLIAILQGLKSSYSLPLMVNGGDTAVREILLTDDTLINSVNQESVFTNINFDKDDGDKDQFGEQGESDRRHYQQYIKECKAHGLEVYLLEYGSKVAESVIRDFCVEKGYHYYVSKDLDLTTPQYGVR